MKARIFPIILMGIILFLAVDCKKEEPLSLLKSKTTIAADSFPGPSVPGAAITEPATNITETGVTINGTVYANCVPTTVTFEYAYEGCVMGLADYEWQTVAAEPVTIPGVPDAGNAYTHVSNTITGLTRGTYMYRVKAVSSLGTQYGGLIDVDILGTGGRFPTVITMEATNIRTDTVRTQGLNTIRTHATLHGIVNANGLPTFVTFAFGYAPGARLGGTQPAVPDTITGYSSTNVSLDISIPLSAGRHFSVVATNPCGTVYGNNMKF
jgi:hypothetical protein